MRIHNKQQPVNHTECTCVSIAQESMLRPLADTHNPPKKRIKALQDPDSSDNTIVSPPLFHVHHPTGFANAIMETYCSENHSFVEKAADARSVDGQTCSEMTGKARKEVPIERVRTTTMPTAALMVNSREDTAKSRLEKAGDPEFSTRSSGPEREACMCVRERERE